MLVFYDTEFLERGPGYPIDLISIGMVAEDGREIYAVNADLNQCDVRTHPWVGEHVWPHLPLVTPPPATRGGGHPRLDLDHPDVRSRNQIARLVSDFLAESAPVRLMADYAAHDHVVLTQLMGTMAELPSHVPMRTSDFRDVLDTAGEPELFELPAFRGRTHHSLDDARHLAECYWHVQSHGR